MKKDAKWIYDIVGAIQYPIVAHPMWAKSVPDNLKRDMPIIRLAQLMKDPELAGVYATDIEAMIYIMTASLAFPLNCHWTQVYMHLTRKYMLDWVKTNTEDLPDFLKEEINLDDYEAGLLRDLKRWIRKKQTEHLKSR